jgi:hypothetical protein
MVKGFPITKSTSQEGFVEQIKGGLEEVKEAGESAYDGFHSFISHVG